MSDEANDQPLPPSKSQLKREAQASTKLGEQLVELDKTRLGQLKLADNIHHAVLEAKKIRSHGARKRQLLYLGKLLRQVDTSEIIATLESFNTQALQQTRAFHDLEQWRDKLLADDQALTELLNQYPDMDRQHVRQLIRTARKEQAQNKPPASARSLFKYLRSVMLED